MNHIGSYDGFKVYELGYGDTLPTDVKYLYVTDGNIYYGGVRIGRLDANYKVLAYDKNIYHKQVQEKKRKAAECAVPVSTSVVTTTAVGPNGELSGTDEFFARVAKDIDDLLKNAKNFSYEMPVG